MLTDIKPVGYHAWVDADHLALFVLGQPATLQLARVSTGKPLVKAVEGSSDRDYAWMPDGKTLLMSAGTKVLSWTRGAAGWTEVFDGAAHKLGNISRLTVSPGSDAVAIVVAEPAK